nr:rod shape-determining protein MreD [Novosphingobium sp. FKTRR1]
MAIGLPWLSIAIASLVTFSPIIASAPVIPPLGYLVFLAWRILRPNLLPLWAGLPLGAWDDLFSGQPFGCAILLWSATMLVMEDVDTRFLWRGFGQDWLLAGLLTTAYIVLGATFAGIAAHFVLPLVIGPQLVMSLVLFPVINATVALLDRIRRLPLRRVT